LQPPPLFADALPALWEQLHVAPEVSVGTPWMLVRRDTGEAAGLAGLVLEEAGTAQIGYAVYLEQAGRGFATEAVRCLVQWSLEWPDQTGPGNGAAPESGLRAGAGEGGIQAGHHRMGRGRRRRADLRG